MVGSGRHGRCRDRVVALTDSKRVAITRALAFDAAHVRSVTADLADPPTETVLHVSELFLSFQGEGPSCGERAVFLRLARCNLSCSWCDTPYTWDWTRFNRDAESRAMSVDDIVEKVKTLAGERGSLLVVTGGEPLLQQSTLTRVLQVLAHTRPSIRCEVETNGTIAPRPELTERVYRFVVSPKLQNSGLDHSKRIRSAVLRSFERLPSSVLKVVVDAEDDLHEVRQLVDLAGFSPSRVWIMPLGTDPDECSRRMRVLADPVLAAGYNLSGRTQVLIWNDARGH
jgi:7-carboxy-7-deazaguanine synthase